MERTLLFHKIEHGERPETTKRPVAVACTSSFPQYAQSNTAITPRLRVIAVKRANGEGGRCDKARCAGKTVVVLCGFAELESSQELLDYAFHAFESSCLSSC